MTDRAITVDQPTVGTDRHQLALDERSMRVLELCLAGLALAVVLALSLLR